MFSFAYCYEGVVCVLKTIKHASFACTDDFSCDANNSESEEPCEKGEKVNFADDFFHHYKHPNKNLISLFTELGHLSSKEHNIFSCCYTQEVYSPPDFLIG